jgi:hypothetical protein
VNIKAIVIGRFAKFMLGGVAFESMKRIVADVNSSAMSGAEKRQAALEEFARLGYALADCLVNLGLELAVAWLKGKTA